MIKFEVCALTIDGEKLYALTIDGQLIRRDLTFDQVVDLIARRDEGADLQKAVTLE